MFQRCCCRSVWRWLDKRLRIEGSYHWAGNCSFVGSCMFCWFPCRLCCLSCKVSGTSVRCACCGYRWPVWCIYIYIYIYRKVLSDERLGAKLRVTESMRTLWFFHLYILSSATTALSTLCQSRLYPHIYMYIYICANNAIILKQNI